MSRLKDQRLEKGMTQNELNISSGIKLTTIQKLESGYSSIMGAKVETIYRLSQALGTTIEALIEEI